MPGALVARFLLAPYHLAPVRVVIQYGFKMILWKRIQLLDTYDRGVGLLPMGTLLKQIKVDLPRAQNDPLDCCAIQSVDFIKHWVKSALRQIRGRRDGGAVAQQTLGCHNNQRPAQ